MRLYSQIPQIKESGISYLMHKDLTDPPARVTILDDQNFDYDIDPKTTKNVT